MGKKAEKTISIIKEILSIIIIFLLGAVGIIFAILYLDTFDYGIIFKYKQIITIIAIAIISILTVLTIILHRKSNGFIYKICYITIVLVSVAITGLYFLEMSGFLDKIDSVESFREYIAGFGNYAVILFILLQFLQVVVLPIPGGITIGAGVLLFGPFKGALYSLIGILAGSLVGFFIGRVFGYKVASWLVGEEDLKKGLKSVKGKDKVVLTFMFLFPFFPDDVLCFVAGLSSMSTWFFIIMITLTRLVSIFFSSYSLNNSFIPYDTWWGLLIWAVLFALMIVGTVFIYKKGDKIEAFFTKRFGKKRGKRKEKK